MGSVVKCVCCEGGEMGSVLTVVISVRVGKGECCECV